jgi:carbamoyltransferase
MKRTHLGLACSGHDNAVAIIDDAGALCFAEATERFLQQKRSLGYPADDLVYAKQLLAKWWQPNTDLILAKTWSQGFASAQRKRANQRLSTHSAERLHGPLDLLIANSIEYSGNHLRARALEQIVQQARDGKVTDRFYEHHLTHAAAACYSSPFTEAVCAVIDGYGEGIAHQFFHLQSGQLAPLKKESLVRGPKTASLGRFYALLCDLCGFSALHGEEWKVMGLSAYGSRNDQLYALLKTLCAVDSLSLVHPVPEADALLRLIPHRRRVDSSPESVADLAHTGQLVFTELLQTLLTNLYALGLSENLILTGGCALNSACNGTILRNTSFENLYVPPAPADDGNAIGAAFLSFWDDHPDYRLEPGFQDPYLGSIIEEDELQRCSGYLGWPIEKIGNGLARYTAEMLANGKIVGWIQGRAEFGPRALGARSILADPRSSTIRDRINASVKFREMFRPLAPVILDERGHDFFQNYRTSPYMEATLSFRPSTAHLVPAVVHEDGTGRVQSIRQNWNPRLYELLIEFDRLTSIPLLLNTSYNLMGKPIAHSLADVLATFSLSAIDVLVVGDFVIKKPTHA